jgi:hypothetical protein
MAKITTISLFGNKSLSAGDVATSDPIDLRYCANNGMFAIRANVSAGTAGTAGTTVFSYTGCSVEGGSYVAPASSVAIGTFGTGRSSDIMTFEPELMAFMKIVATQSGSGTSGKDSKITAELLVQ